MFEAGTGLFVAETMRSALHPALHVSSLYDLRRYGRCFNFSVAVGTLLLLLNLIGLIVSGTIRRDFTSFIFKIMTIPTHWKIIKLCLSLVG